MIKDDQIKKKKPSTDINQIYLNHQMKKTTSQA